MEIIQVVGKREVSFTDDKTGKPVEGVSLYFLIQHDQVEGMMAEKMFLSKDRQAGMDYIPVVGEKVAVDYDRYGKPSRFKPVK